MSLESYKLSRQYVYSNPRKEMLREKEIQVHSLYELAMDREDDTLLNGNVFTKSPRIFDRKFVDTVHHKITVETIHEDDWIECGDYLEYDGMVWLCLNSYSFHKLYCRATFMSCDWQIYWMNDKGEIKNQYVIDQNSTQYNSGEFGNSTITLGTSQHMLKMQCNAETVMFDSPQRFAIDRNIKKPTCYKVTQNDTSSYNYGKGLCCVTVSETQFNPDKDKYITLPNGQEVWICDYIPASTSPSTPLPPSFPSDETTILNAIIIGSKNIKVGFSRTFTATLSDNNDNVFEWDDTLYVWNVVSDFGIKKNIAGNKIQLFIDNENFIGSSFLLQVIKLNDGTIIGENKITVMDVV